MEIQVYSTKDPGMIDQVYRLRYEVFALEQGREAFADHVNQKWIDTHDQYERKIIVAVYDLKVIGTMRVVYRRSGPIIQEESYLLPTLAETVGETYPSFIEKLALIDRGAVNTEFRGRRLWNAMLAECMKTAYEGNNIGFCLGTTSDPKLFRSMERLGWIQYCSLMNSWGLTSECFYHKRS